MELFAFPRAMLMASVVFLGLAASVLPASEPAASPVTYEAFGAKGDGLTDDLPSIVAAHAHANANGLPVRSNPAATYHLGRRALTAIIQTDTDWGTSRFIIDDSQGVEDHKQSLFEVTSRLAPVALAIERLTAGQDRLDVRPERDVLVYVENDQRRRFIRKGLNRNSGTTQKEVFILRADGTIDGAIEWDYETVTRVEALPIDPEPLLIQGGVFINIANRMRQPEGYNYWFRNLVITRSNTEVRGLIHQAVGETDVGHPYAGFLSARRAAHVTYRDCRVDSRKVYTTIGTAGEPVSMGSYGYRADLVVHFSMIGCRMGWDIHDRGRWGVAATNFMKHVLLEDCVLSRMDVHQGVSGTFVIRRSILGHQGIKAVGKGTLLVEDSVVHSDNLVSFRGDYGSPWDGEVIVRRSRWVPIVTGGRPVQVFGMSNDGTHDFGYPCSMPRSVTIDGLVIDDSGVPGDRGLSWFGNPLGSPTEPVTHSYRLTERLELREVLVASGRRLAVSTHPDLVAAISVVE